MNYQATCLSYLPLALADNSDLDINTSWYHAHTYPMIAWWVHIFEIGTFWSYTVCMFWELCLTACMTHCRLVFCMHIIQHACLFACMSYCKSNFLKSSLLKTKCLYVFVLCFVNIYIPANLWHTWPNISWHTSSCIHLGTRIPTEGPNRHISSTLLITHDYFLLCLHLYDIKIHENFPQARIN